MLQIHCDGVLRNQNWNGYIISERTVLLTPATTPVEHISCTPNATLPIKDDGKPLNLIVVNISKVFQWTFFVYDDNVARAVQTVKDFVVSLRLSHASNVNDIAIVSKNTLKVV